MQKTYWFRAKDYGWGWYPATWQGWVVLLSYLGSIVGLFVSIDRNSHSVSDTLIAFLPLELLLTILLIAICYKTGEKPEWRWGRKKEE